MWGVIFQVVPRSLHIHIYIHIRFLNFLLRTFQFENPCDSGAPVGNLWRFVFTLSIISKLFVRPTHCYEQNGKMFPRMEVFHGPESVTLMSCSCFIRYHPFLSSHSGSPFIWKKVLNIKTCFIETLSKSAKATFGGQTCSTCTWAMGLLFQSLEFRPVYLVCVIELKFLWSPSLSQKRMWMWDEEDGEQRWAPEQHRIGNNRKRACNKGMAWNGIDMWLDGR